MNLLRNIRKKELYGKVVLVRVDLNIKDNTEFFRFDASIPTLVYLLRQGVKKVVIVSHRGRFDRKRNHTSQKSKISLSSFVSHIARRTKVSVDFVSANNIESLVNTACASEARIVLLENIRFFPEEEKNSKRFAKVLASCADMYVNDAFAVSHRKHASVYAITKFLPSYAGLLVEQEVEHLAGLLKNPKRPFVLVVGGAKISDKLGVVKMFQNKAEKILIGGAAANTCLAAQGFSIGSSLYEPKMLPEARKIGNKKNVFLPTDVHVLGKSIFDIGPEAIKFFTDTIADARTLVWSGPMGLFEKKGFETGTRAIWKAIIENTQVTAVIGGGETVASSKLIPNFKSKISQRKNIFLSTGGGAMLEYLSGKTLPGIKALEEK